LKRENADVDEREKKEAGRLAQYFNEMHLPQEFHNIHFVHLAFKFERVFLAKTEQLKTESANRTKPVACRFGSETQKELESKVTTPSIGSVYY
jgi:hypothetical protein